MTEKEYETAVRIATLMDRGIVTFGDLFFDGCMFFLTTMDFEPRTVTIKCGKEKDDGQSY